MEGGEGVMKEGDCEGSDVASHSTVHVLASSDTSMAEDIPASVSQSRYVYV